VGIYEKRDPSAPAKQVDEASGGVIGSVLSKGDIQGKQGEMLMLYGLSGVKASRVMLLGLGSRNRQKNSRSIGPRNQTTKCI